MKKTLSILLSLALVFSNVLVLNVKAEPIPESELDITWITDKDSFRGFCSISFSDGLLKVYKGTPTMYTFFGEDPYAGVERIPYKSGFINKNGKIAIPLIYDEVSEHESYFMSEFKDGLCEVKQNGKYGYINTKGEVVVPIEYDWTANFSEGLAIASKNKKVGFVDKQGKVVIPLQYDGAKNFSEGYALVNRGDKYAYIDKTGKEITPFIYEGDDWLYVVGSFSNGMARVKRDGKVGYIDTSGKEVIPCMYENGIDFLDSGTVYVGDFSGKSHFINKNNEIITTLSGYGMGLNFSEGLAEHSIWEHGYIDENGKNVIPYIYDSAQEFQDGVARVEKNGRWGCIDKNGNKIVPCIYNSIGNFHNGFATIENLNEEGRYDKAGIIDKYGNVIVPHDTYDGLNHGGYMEFSEGLAWVSKDGKHGYINTKGEVVVPLIFDDVEIFSDGVALVKKDGKHGILKNPLPESERTYKLPEAKQAAVNNNQVTPNAKYSKQNITVNGEFIKDLEVYNIDGHNYFKLRDIAKLADGKESKFSVNWNGEKQLISIKTGEAYKAKGTELKAGDGTDKVGTKSTAKVEVNGEIKELNAYTIKDQNYFEIRPLGDALNFGVEWNDKTQTVELKM